MGSRVGRTEEAVACRSCQLEASEVERSRRMARSVRRTNPTTGRGVGEGFWRSPGGGYGVVEVLDGVGVALGQQSFWPKTRVEQRR
ncbi:uncharacterized protein M6B38_287665 [Iris pallida]|uniref:Uncharacterized protein n=1 Tax=Iris pallida TaxID=29817 RepID=A0AAX6HY33_IRIPA|nr:uncharacterized protein M6B38_287665 [Iris pallida]